MDTYPVRQGTALHIAVNLEDSQGQPITGYTGSEALAATAWPGGNRAASFTAAAAWLAPAAGTISVLVTAAQSATLAPGRYRGELTLLDPSDGLLEAYAWAMDVEPTAGSSALPLCYCAFPDLLRHGRAWLKALQDDDDQAGFVGQCADASRRLDDLIIARYPTANLAILGDPGYGALVWGGNPGSIPNLWLRGVLAAGGLVVRPKVVQACALWALGSICKAQVGPDDKGQAYLMLGRRYESEASAIALTLTAELSTDGSGVPNLSIPLGATSLRPNSGC